ncbi:hypothetical protein GE061_011571 [Apolygus lucorum]|uniref:Leucine-rich repeat-containing protein 40 n=1 Tax=Apolygus lucorum TaxID=248454 RepID=A0A8S9XY66_APOLU|nr:hypothetical protein GE061_011571 [Apolygus lucorum]
MKFGFTKRYEERSSLSFTSISLNLFCFLKRGFCNQQEYETTADSHNTSGLTNFSNELDSSLIKNQQRQFSKLVSSQVNELKKVSSITSKSAKRNRCAGTRSKTSARNVRFSPRNRPGFCDTPSGTELIESGSSLQTDCEEDIENNLNRPLVTFERIPVEVDEVYRMSRMQKKEVETVICREHNRRKHTIMSPEDANSGKKSNWSEMEITGTIRNLSPQIWEWTHLTALYLNDNCLTRLPPDIGRLVSLRVLDLSCNKLRSLPAELGELIYLREVLLNQNHLRVLPYELGKLFQLQVLGLAGNPLSKEVLKLYHEPNGTQKLITYLLDSLQGIMEIGV